MSMYGQGLLIAIACAGLFLFFDKFGRSTVRALLSGPFNKFYLNYLSSSTKHEMEVAFAENNLDRAWTGMIFQKVYEIGVSSLPYSRREKNLEYIKAEVASKPQLSRRLADELIKVLPKQYRNLDFQSNLACYICELLKHRNNSDHNGSQSLKPIQGADIDHLTSVFSAWIAGGIYLLLSINMLDLDKYPPFLVVLSNIVLFILMVLPLYPLIGTALAKLTTVGAIATIIVLALGVFATVAHRKAQLPIELDLNPYQNPNAKLTIRSAEWLTMNSASCDGKEKVSVSLHGQLVVPIRFHVNDNRFYFTDKDCGGIVPQIEITQSENQSYEFYIVAQDSTPFFSKKKDIEIAPSYILASREIDFGSGDMMHIKLEHGFWNLMSKFYVAMGSFSATALFYFMNSVLNKRSP